MLEYVGAPGTYHFNFPNQNGVSHIIHGELPTKNGAYTEGSVPDCPWADTLNLRLWFSPELEPIVKYYRLTAFKLDTATGATVGDPIVLNRPVSWTKLIRDSAGDIVTASDPLGPVTPMSGETNLFKVPYWNRPERQYLTGQFHQSWNTTVLEDGKYMLVLEVFDDGGNRIKPTGATGPGTEQAFEFRRWAGSAANTDPVAYADLANVFWVDNTPVRGEIVDLRQDHDGNTGECQFMEGTADTTFGIGFRAFHVNGVDHSGDGDANSFMRYYTIHWQRGLHGSTGELGPSPVYGNNHTDVGETGDAVESGTKTFAEMLGGQSKCTFSVTLHVAAKHYNGASHISRYDYEETASFALSITGTDSGK